MSWVGLRAWARFYAKLTLIAAWNGFLCWFAVLVGVGGVQTVSTLTALPAAGAVDLRAIHWQGALWTLLGTIATAIGFALARHLMPEPPEPPPPA